MSKATLRLVTSAVAMVCIATTQFEMSVFAQAPVKKSPAVSLSTKIRTAFDAPASKPAIRWTDRANGPATPAEKSSKKKWILLAIAGGGGAAVAFMVMNKKETPTITVGTPTIGNQ
jgi:hypothetical protein